MSGLFESYELNRFGLYVPERIAKRPIAIDLFCGAGGISLGFIQAGFEVIAGLDFDYYCMMTYLVNLGSYPCKIHYIDPADEEKVNAKMEKDMKKEAKKNGGVLKQPVSGSGWIKHNPEFPPVTHYFYGDCRKITGQEILDAIGLKQGDVDCVMGGPPCQGFSRAGKQDVTDPRNSLVFDFARLVLEIQPKTFVMENVPGILSMVTPEGIPVIDAFCRILSDGGFGSYEALKQSLLNTAGAGAALKGGNKKLSRKEELGNGDDEGVEKSQMTLV